MNSLQRHNFWIHLLYLYCPAVIIMSRPIRCIEIFRLWSFRHSLDSNESPERILHPDSDCGMRNNIRFMAKLRVRKSLYAIFLRKTAWCLFWILCLAFPPILFLELILLSATPSFHIHNVYFWSLSLIVKGQVEPYFKNQDIFFTKIRR